MATSRTPTAGPGDSHVSQPRGRGSTPYPRGFPAATAAALPLLIPRPEDHPMRRCLPPLLLALAAPSPSARADHPTPYKGRFDFTTVSVVPVSATMLYVRGSLVGNETHLGHFTGEVEYFVDVTTLE